jgi:hypothetical protein
MGYMRRADEVNQFTWVAYQQRNPVGIFNSLYINANQWLNWDFGGNFLFGMANTNTSMNFRNQYYFYASVTRVGENVTNTELRGGPALKRPGDLEISTSISSDSRKKFYFGLGGYTEIGDESYYHYKNAWVDFYYRPTNAMRLTFSPFMAWYDPELQYVGTEGFGDEDRYLYASLSQKTASLTFRLDYCIRPNLTVQYYGSPFISAGQYSEFKRITDPMADRYTDRFQRYDGEQITYSDENEVYFIDEDKDGITDYEFDQPDFNVRDFNSNLVIRWEYCPGSVLYLVWSQARSDYQTMGKFNIRHDFDELFTVYPHNVFLVKINRWFSL